MTKETTLTGTLSIMVHESISVIDSVVIGIIYERLTTWQVKSKGSNTLVSITEYRKLVGDYTSKDEHITDRLQYLESFCRNIIKLELDKN